MKWMERVRKRREERLDKVRQVEAEEKRLKEEAERRRNQEEIKKRFYAQKIKKKQEDLARAKEAEEQTLRRQQWMVEMARKRQLAMQMGQIPAPPEAYPYNDAIFQQPPQPIVSQPEPAYEEDRVFGYAEDSGSASSQPYRHPLEESGVGDEMQAIVELAEREALEEAQRRGSVDPAFYQPTMAKPIDDEDSQFLEGAISNEFEIPLQEKTDEQSNDELDAVIASVYAHQEFSDSEESVVEEQLSAESVGFQADMDEFDDLQPDTDEAQTSALGDDLETT